MEVLFDLSIILETDFYQIPNTRNGPLNKPLTTTFAWTSIIIITGWRGPRSTGSLQRRPVFLPPLESSKLEITHYWRGKENSIPMLPPPFPQSLHDSIHKFRHLQGFRYEGAQQKANRWTRVPTHILASLSRCSCRKEMLLGKRNQTWWSARDRNKLG